MDYQKTLERTQLFYKACSILGIPTIITEQYPQGLGKTVFECSEKPYEKSSFSCLGEPKVVKALKERKNWLIAGIEAHVCVLQTVRDLLKHGYTPIVLKDAISSRNKVDLESSLDEMKRLSVRITTVETVLFELMQDARHPHFKELSRLIK